MSTPTPRPPGLDALLDHVAANLPEPLPAVGEKWFCNTSDGIRTVTVNRVWAAGDDGHTAVGFEWRDNKPGQHGSALPLGVFLGTYKPVRPDTADTLPQWLHQRFGKYLHGGDYLPWEQAEEADREFWAHEAAAVRRAVARGGFRNPADADGEQP